MRFRTREVTSVKELNEVRFTLRAFCKPAPELFLS